MGKQALTKILIGALALGLALSVAGCGRKGPVEPPVQSQS